jgi:DnaD/phage-associated family protein
MLAESLKDAEQSYPASWVRDAIRLAVENNKRSWRYIEAILSRWKEQGRDERKNRRDTEKARRRYADWEDN